MSDEFNKKEKKPRTYKLGGDVRSFLDTRPNATAFIEGLIRREKAREKNIFVIDLGGFTSNARNEILENLQKEGVAVQEVTSRISSGFGVE